MARKKNKDFLNEFLGKEPVDVDKLKKNAIKHDRFDKEDVDHLMEEMREFASSEDKLTEKVETGGSAFRDAFFSLMKADPKLENPNEVRPSHQVNRAVAEELMGLKEHEMMRSYSVGDEISAALATIAMEPELETLFDKLEQEQKLADELQQQMQDMQDLQQEDKDVDELMRQLEAGELDDPNGQQSQNFQDQKSKIQQAMEALQNGIDQSQQELREALEKAGPTMQASLRQAMKDALDGAANMDQAAQTWGLDPGTLHRMSPQERIELARKLNNDRFKKIAALFGPMRNMAFAEQQRKTIHSNDEIYDLETGNDLSRILSAELMNIRHPTLKKDFYRRFYEGDLLQYKLRGSEKLAKGAIICCIDGSGSMAGDPEMYSKAFGLTLLQIAKAQKRAFYAIEFGGPRTLIEFDFRDPKNITPENVIAFAESFMGGGTDFHTPLARSLDLLKEEHSKTGAVKADIVFVTDGMCGVDENFMKQFKAEQERISFRVYGVAIGCPVDSEPLKTICDGRVLPLQSFVNGEDLRTIFRAL